MRAVDDGGLPSPALLRGAGARPFRGRVSSWNLRDAHMVETAEALPRHLESVGERPKIVIWAHNSHLGDARATEMGERGEWNIGHLLRERHGRKVFSVGFTTDTGTVTAVSEWDGPAERKRVRSALPGSYETRRSGLAAFKRPSDSARRPFRRPWTGWCPSKGDGNGA